MKETITASILFAISIFLFYMSIRSFMEKGFLFNNAYIHASKQEREKMNKSHIIANQLLYFCCLGSSFY